MKRITVKRILALGLSLVTILSAVACGGPKDAEDAAADTQEESSETEADGVSEDAANEETTVFTIGVPYANYGNGIHTDKNAFLQLLKEELNVELEFVVYDGDSFSLMAASGDVCDLMVLSASTKSVITQLIDSGSLMALDDLLAEYGQNIQANIPDAIESVRSADGKVYCLPTHVSYASDTPRDNGWIGFRARYDIYKAIGSPEITDEDSYLEVLKQMVEYERERTGEDDIYAFSSFTDWGTWPYYICYPFMQGLMDTSIGAYDRTTGEYVDEYLDENSPFWAGVEFFNKAYRMGIFDVDGMTQKHQQYKDKVAAGKLIADIYGGDPDTALCGEEAIMTYLPGQGSAFGTLCGTYEASYPIGYQQEASRAISAKCENPELAMQVWDFLDSEVGAISLLNGVQGEDWDYVDGVPQVTDSVLAMYQDGTASDYLADRTGENFCKWSLFSGVLASGNAVNLTTSEEFLAATASDAEKAFAQDFGDYSYPGQVYDKWVKDGEAYDISTDEGAMKTAFVPTLSEESLSIGAEREEYVAANISKLVMAESEDEFATEKANMIAKFYEMGLDKAIEEEKANFESSHAKYAEIYGN